MRQVLATVSLGKEVNVSSSAAGAPHTAVCQGQRGLLQESSYTQNSKEKGQERDQMRMGDRVKPVPVTVVQKGTSPARDTLGL